MYGFPDASFWGMVGRSFRTEGAMSQTTTQTAPPSASQSALPVLLGGGLLLVIVLYLVASRFSRPRVSRTRLDPDRVSKARKRYVSAVDKRLSSDKLDQYSVLLDTRNMVNGFYEQKGQVVGARFSVKSAHCRRCKALDGQEFSLLDPERLAAHTPPLHGEVRRGVHCVATLIPIRAEEAKKAPARK